MVGCVHDHLRPMQGLLPNYTSFGCARALQLAIGLTLVRAKEHNFVSYLLQGASPPVKRCLADGTPGDLELGAADTSFYRRIYSQFQGGLPMPRYLCSLAKRGALVLKCVHV